MATGLYTLTLRDNTNEPSTMSIHTPALDDSNINSVLADMIAFETAVAGLSDGAISKQKLTAVDQTRTYTVPASQTVQKGIKFTISYRDSVTGSNYYVQLPCADLTVLPTGNEKVILTANPGLAFKTAFEALAVSPAGNPVVITQISYND